MSRWMGSGALAAAIVFAVSVAPARADHRDRTLIVTMTNDASANQIQVYDAATHALLQTLSTHGKGGVGGNARGVRQHDGELFAAVNNGSNSVALFRRDGDGLRFEKLVTTTSAPVSLDFGNDHLYVAGATTIDSFVMRRNTVLWLDGTTALELAGGATPPSGSTAQVGVVNREQVLVTLKADPDPGTVDVVALHDGAVSNNTTAVSAPAGSLAPFGFSVNADGTALITLAHSAQDGLFRNGAFVTAVGSAGQVGPCWTTRAGKYVFTANTGSGTISRLVSTGGHIFVDAPAAATVVTGGNPLDLDSNDGVLALLDHGGGQAHLSVFSYNAFGELTALGAPISIAAPSANGVAILAPRDDDRR